MYVLVSERNTVNVKIPLFLWRAQEASTEVTRPFFTIRVELITCPFHGVPDHFPSVFLLAPSNEEVKWRLRLRSLYQRTPAVVLHLPWPRSGKHSRCRPLARHASSLSSFPPALLPNHFLFVWSVSNLPNETLVNFTWTKLKLQVCFKTKYLI